MDYLQEGIGLRAMAQRDPLVEYQREGYEMFNAMLDGLKEESVGYLFNLEVEVQESPIVEENPVDGDAASEDSFTAKGLDTGKRPAHLSYSAPNAEGGVETHDEETDDSDVERVPRNAPCPCGSGKKYKRCHGDPKRKAQVD